MTRTAICRCGASAVEVEGEPALNAICHCSYCKRRSGGPCGWSAVFLGAQLVGRRGEFTVYVSEGVGGRATNSFCARCGTTLFSVPDERPGIFWTPGGCFIDNPLGEPTATYSDDQRCAWLSLPDSWTVRSTEMVEASRRR